MAIHLVRPIKIPCIPAPVPTPSLSELYDLPRDFLDSPTNASPSLRSSLLATSRQLQTTTSLQSSSNSYIAPRSFIVTLLEEHEEEAEEDEDELNELVWNDSTVQWRVISSNRGGTSRLIRSWDYTSLEEKVKMARFVQFKDCTVTTTATNESQQATTRSDKVQSLWGPYRDTGTEKGTRSEWSDEVLKLPTEPPFPSSSSSLNNNNNSSKGSPVLRPYLLIVLSTLAFLHPLATRHPFPQSIQEGGEGEIPIHLPFKVDNVYPLQTGGVLFERAREGEEALSFNLKKGKASSSMMEERQVATVPIWWSLSSETGAYGELKPVSILPSPEDEGSLVGSKRTTVLRDFNEKLVFVSNDFRRGEDGRGDEDDRIKVGVSVNESKGKVIVWRYDKVESYDDTKSMEEGGGKDKEESINLGNGSPESSRRNLRRQSTKGRISIGGGGGAISEFELSHYSDSNKSLPLGSVMRGGRGGGGTGSGPTIGRRRSARLSHAHDTSSTANDVLAALDSQSRSHPLPPLTPHDGSTRPSLRRTHTLHNDSREVSGGGGGGGGGGIISPENRRTSLTRNDLSVTMDRMALSQGSSVGAGGGGGGSTMMFHAGMLLGGGLGLGGVEALMDREATVYLGEEEWADQVGRRGAYDGESASDWVMKKVWEGDLDGTSSKGIQVALFDQRSPTTATLSILLPAASTLLLLSLSLDQTTNDLTCTPIKQVDSKDACAVTATRSTIKDLLLLKPSGDFGLISSQGIELAIREGIKAGEHGQVQSDAGKNVVLVSSQRTRTLTRIKLGGGNEELGQKVLETVAQVLGHEEFSELLKNVLGRTRPEAGFERVRKSVEEIFGLQEGTAGRAKPTSHADASFLHRLRTSPQTSSTIPATASIISFTPSHLAILLSLHLLVQSFRLRISTTSDAEELAKLVVRLASAMGARGWVDEYRRTWGPEIAGFGSNLISSNIAAPSGLLPKTPPNIVTQLYNLLSCQSPPDSTPFSLSSVAQLFCPDQPSFYYGSSSSPLSPMSALIEIYTLLSPSSAQSPSQRAHQAMFRFHELGYTAETLQDLPFGISVPVREAMRSCQLDPPELCATDGGNRDGFWSLIGRRELERFPMRYGDTKKRRSELTTPAANIDALVHDAERALSTPDWQQSKGVSDEKQEDKPSLDPIPRAARFNEDKRMEEVARMLQYVEPVVIAPGEKTLDQLTPQVQQSILSALSYRTFALPVGAAMYHLGSIRQSSSDSLKVPKINTAARMVPMSSPVPLAEKERDPAAATVPERSEWPDFHVGVNAALRLDLEGGKPVDSSKISFNRPTDLDARHAGLLLGLGLKGQLGSMLSSQAYDYLKAKHDPTSVAILLGLAVTFLGTSDSTVTSVISIHLPALHPPRSSSLNVSGMTKSAAAVALGLLHFGTGRRSLADVLVREMCGVRITNVEDASACREAYALSCGFAFGFIMLGQGGRAGSSTSAGEVDLLRVFRALILGENNRPLPGAFFPPSSSSAPIDVNITSSAATVGLALMFLKTERQDVANIFEIPDSPRRLDYVRSDVLLLRALGSSLVMWNSISPSKEWIESALPPFLAGLDPTKPMDSDWEVARWSIIAGACFAIGFKLAGTATAEAHATLIHYMDRLTRACYVKATAVQSKIKRHSLRTCLGVVSIALSMVMAGTGELNVLRRLRVAHGHFSEGLTYGYHLSTHMALGLLFLGEAKYTLSNANGAIAALLLALYPVFPSTSTDNRSHLQAYRHLWVLAAEPRYLEARDIDSNEPVFLPVRLRLVDQTQEAKDGKKAELKSKQLVAPTLIPDVRLLDSIQVESPRYWGFTVRLNATSNQFSRFLRDSTLYVKRRTGHLSYAQDPRGIRSIFTRSKSETGSAVYDFGETTRMLNPSASGLRDFVAAFSDDAEAIAATEQLCVPADANRSPSDFEAFCASVLLECLTKDKRDISSVYHSMFHAHSLLSPSLNPSTATLFAAEQLRLVVDFYKRGTFKTLFGRSSSSKQKSPALSSSSREPLLNPAFVDHVSSTLSSRIDSIASSSSSDLLATYLATPGSWPSSSVSTVPLALLLSKHSVPDFTALEQLHQLVRSSKQDSLSDGELEIMLRCTSKTIESSGKKAWSKEVSQTLSKI